MEMRFWRLTEPCRGEEEERGTDDTHSHSSGGMNGCCTARTAEETRVPMYRCFRPRVVPTGRITVTTTRCHHYYRNRTRVTHDRSRRRRSGNTYIRGFTTVLLLPVGTSHTSFYECDHCARPSCPDFRRAMEFRYFRREVGNHERRSSPSKQRGIRVPPLPPLP